VLDGDGAVALRVERNGRRFVVVVTAEAG